MFDVKIYQNRRKKLLEQLNGGIAVFFGNAASPINYENNTYRFRQDSSFLYFFGIEEPDLIGILDMDTLKCFIFGDEKSKDDVIWSGKTMSLKELATLSGISIIKPYAEAYTLLNSAIKQKRKIHYLPQYRKDNVLKMEEMLGIKSSYINLYSSKELVLSVVNQRLVKSQCEISEIRRSLSISRKMYEIAFSMAKSGVCEQEIVGAIEGYAISKGYYMSFPTILSKDGHILHNTLHKNMLKDEDIFVLDSGVESPMRYSSDITRTIPINMRFTKTQKDIYDIVLNAQMLSIDMLKPGVLFYDAHISAAKIITRGLVDIGVMNGNCDDIVESGAYTLFFPHGLGHALGLDVHDMESFGEDFVGYDETIKRSLKFGLSSLRFAKKLKKGYVVTVEPGIYFIPELINRWSSSNMFKEFINYDKVKSFMKFGGIRIEDDVVITDDSYEILSKDIPKVFE